MARTKLSHRHRVGARQIQKMWSLTGRAHVPIRLWLLQPAMTGGPTDCCQGRIVSNRCFLLVKVTGARGLEVSCLIAIGTAMSWNSLQDEMVAERESTQHPPYVVEEGVSFWRRTFSDRLKCRSGVGAEARFGPSASVFCTAKGGKLQQMTGSGEDGRHFRGVGRGVKTCCKASGNGSAHTGLNDKSGTFVCLVAADRTIRPDDDVS